MIDPVWPAQTLFTVTPNDNTVFADEVRQLYVGTGGNVSVVTSDGATVTFSNVVGGTTLGPFFIRRVRATGTTASNIVAFT